jgi:hypothetical protein
MEQEYSIQIFVSPAYTHQASWADARRFDHRSEALVAAED